MASMTASFMASSVFLAMMALASPTSQQATFDQDMMELRHIGKTYQMAWEIAEQKPDEFVDLVRNYKSAVLRMQTVYSKYKPDVDANNDRGKTVKSAGKSATIGFQTFIDSAGDFAKQYPDRYGMHLSNAKRDAAEAENQKMPGLYRSAMHQLELAEWHVTILVAFNGDKDPTAVKCSREISTLRTDYSAKEVILAKATARIVKDPTEVYRGTDKEGLRSGVLTAWKKAHPNDKVIKIVFDKPAWKHNKKSRWNDASSAWQHVNKSFLELSVVVQKDVKTAQIFAAFVNKENSTGVISYGVDTKGSNFVVDELELSKIKQ